MKNFISFVVLTSLSMTSFLDASTSLLLKNVHTKKTTVLRIVQGDILAQKVDVIVNAANESLRGGGGVCGAIFKAAGWDTLQKECFSFPAHISKWHNKGVRCNTGDAAVTSSGALEKQGIKAIIHAVGPDCRVIKDPSLQKSLLYSAYTKSLERASGLSFKSIAFPFISSAIFACPAELAATTALEALKEFVVKNQNNSLEEIVMVLFDKESYSLFAKKLT